MVVQSYCASPFGWRYETVWRAPFVPFVAVVAVAHNVIVAELAYIIRKLHADRPIVVVKRRHGQFQIPVLCIWYLGINDDK